MIVRASLYVPKTESHFGIFFDNSTGNGLSLDGSKVVAWEIAGSDHRDKDTVDRWASSKGNEHFKDYDNGLIEYDIILCFESYEAANSAFSCPLWKLGPRRYLSMFTMGTNTLQSFRDIPRD